MQREDFICTIGYDGNNALVDKRARARYGKADAATLLEQGLFRQAFCAALYDGGDEGLENFAAAFSATTGMADMTPLKLKRLFGVFEVPGDEINVKRV